MAHDELGDLLRRAAAGDRDAFGEFVRSTQGEVWRLCRALLPASPAEDATQEVYLRVWRAAGTFRAESSARTWLYTITRRTCFETLRRVRRHDLPALQSEPTPVGDPVRSLVLQDLIRHLEPDRRMAFVLTQLHGLSYEEAAEVCDCRIGTIRSRVARARAQLIGELESGGADEVGPPG